MAIRRKIHHVIIAADLAFRAGAFLEKSPALRRQEQHLFSGVNRAVAAIQRRERVGFVAHPTDRHARQPRKDFPRFRIRFRRVIHENHFRHVMLHGLPLFTAIALE